MRELRLEFATNYEGKEGQGDVTKLVRIKYPIDPIYREDVLPLVNKLIATKAVYEPRNGKIGYKLNRMYIYIEGEQEIPIKSKSNAS